MALNDRDQAKAILSQSGWLKDHGADLTEPLLTHGRLLRLQHGQWAQAEGDDQTGLLVVIAGEVQMFCKAPGDREVLMGHGGAGLAIGQTLRFGGGPRLVTVISLGETLVLQVTDRALTRIAAEAPQIWQAVAALLYLQLRGLVQLVAETIALPPRQRLAARLDLLSAGARDRSLLRLSQQALAEMLGLTRKTVNAYLAEFERDGLIRRGYGEITLLDRRRLRAVAERP
ncbi:MAG: Crp/Fnr family transcriptional regulator [Caulobacter sp.]|nr:Crp/Fnr family transcriptional regulator [Caulobacter sp.]